MATVPTRNSSDPNASADINTLQDQITDNNGLVKASDTDTDPGSLTDKLVAGSNVTISLVNTGTAGEQEVEIASSGGGGGGSTEPDPFFPAGSFDFPVTNPAPPEVINSGSITNVRLLGHAFDDTTNETVTREFKVPSDIDTTGNVTFKLIGIAETAASADVEYRFSHSASNSSESADVAYTDEDSGAKAVDTTQDDNTYMSWTMAASKWAAGDMVKFQLTRVADGGNDDLNDDFYVRSLEIAIPRI